MTSTINYYRAAFQYGDAADEKYYKQKLTVPTLSIFGTADKYLSVDSAKGSAKFIENFKQEFIEGAGHWVQQEVPEKVNKIMDNYLRSK